MGFKNLIVVKKRQYGRYSKFKIWKRNSTSTNKADYTFSLDRFRLAIQTEKADWYYNRINIADNRPRI